MHYFLRYDRGVGEGRKADGGRERFSLIATVDKSCDGVVHHLYRGEVPCLHSVAFVCVWDFGVREFMAVPLYLWRSHLHCGMPATGSESQRLNSPSGPSQRRLLTKEK